MAMVLPLLSRARFTILTAVSLTGLGACASTTAPLPPPVELLLVVNSGEQSLSILPLPDLPTQNKVDLGAPTTALASVSANRQFAVIATGGPALVLVDGALQRLTRLATFPGDAVLTDALFLSDSIAVAADPGRSVLVRFNVFTGDTTSIPLPGRPNALTISRSRLFVLNGNGEPCQDNARLCPLGPSWITVLDPLTLASSGSGDSIPLLGDGGGRFIAGGSDGFVYVVSQGEGPEAEGRLAIVDPVRRTEVGSFGGLGSLPGRFAIDGSDRLLISSEVDGLMEFNTRSRSVTRGPTSSIPVDRNAGVAVDIRRRILAIESGPCLGGTPGRVRLFRPDLTEIRFVLLGQCSGSATVAFIPPPPADE